MGQLIGTIDYISPEQARALPATTASDVYSLACVFYECLTGEVPFDRASEPAVLYAHMIDPPPRLSERRPDLPGALDEVIVAAGKGRRRQAGLGGGPIRRRSGRWARGRD